MISDLVKFGSWLNETNHVDFGKTTKDEDLILPVFYNDERFNFGKISKKEDIALNYYNKSCFCEELYHTTNQNIMIPSKSNLIGFTPFLIKLDHDFLKNGEKDYSEKGKINKFKGKISRSLDANKNNKDFAEIVNKYINDDFEKLFLNQCPLSDDEKNNFKEFLALLDAQKIDELIVNYYEFLDENSEEIIDIVINFKDSEDYNKRERGNFYLICIFSDIRDMINDFFFYYSKFLKKRNKSTNDFEEGTCSFCGKKGITYPNLGYYALANRHLFNYGSSMRDSKLRVCKSCNSLITFANEKLGNVINLSNIKLNNWWNVWDNYHPYSFVVL